MEFKFTSSTALKYNITVFLWIFVFLFGTFFIGTCVRITSIIIIIYSLTVIPLIVLIILKPSLFFKAEPITVSIDSDGFELKERNIKAYWNEMDWYDFQDITKQSEKGLITIKLKTGKKIRILYLKKGDYQEEWIRFTEYFIKMMKENCTDIRSLYDLPVWNLITYVMIGMIVLFPLLFLVTGIKIPLVASYFLIIGICLTSVAKIRNNRTLQKTIESKKDTKQ